MARSRSGGRFAAFACTGCATSTSAPQRGDPRHLLLLNPRAAGQPDACPGRQPRSQVDAPIFILAQVCVDGIEAAAPAGLFVWPHPQEHRTRRGIAPEGGEKRRGEHVLPHPAPQWPTRAWAGGLFDIQSSTSQDRQPTTLGPT